ncbi:hypothetical protein A7981_04940 [Methylovorus sp. MM2]|uniref:beta strand repeat-containing protein n=1 Tax=Methylovorus sp. MM2 TaxID=1848038 RepID=UPI0007E1B55E|nr:PD40 domain-containing protein [Methylovorus sp. MM2]OAM52791.1 hypothetical protein A7981_04940 [Methylovorus sp. MM2]
MPTFISNFLSSDAIREAFGGIDAVDEQMESLGEALDIAFSDEYLGPAYEVVPSSILASNNAMSGRLVNGDSFNITGKELLADYPHIYSFIYRFHQGGSVSFSGDMSYYTNPNNLPGYENTFDGYVSKLIIESGQGSKVTYIGRGNIESNGDINEFVATSMQLQIGKLSLVVNGEINLSFVDDIDDVSGIVTGFNLTSGKYSFSMSGLVLDAVDFDAYSESGFDFLDNLLAGNDTLDGNVSNNMIYGLVGDDSINGLSGNDILYGGEGSDTLVGGIGNDTLDGGDGDDSLVGGAGNDVYIVGEFGDIVDETISGSSGLDRVKLGSTYDMTHYDLTDNVENLDASAVTTVWPSTWLELYGNSLANVIIGSSSNDYLIGLDGNDTLIGGAGDDILLGGAGVDNLQGGAGNDTYNVNLKTIGTGVNITAALEDTITDTAGTADTLVLLGGLGANKTSTITLVAALENLDASSAEVNNTIVGAVALNLTGNASNNEIIGSNGKNTILGLAGNDTIDGLDGDDSIDGGVGNDSLSGGDGDDTYVVALKLQGSGAGANVIIEDTIDEALDEGRDTLRLAGSAKLTNASTIELTGDLANIENIDASLTGSTLLNLIGNGSSNYLIGNSAANWLDGGDGDDTLDGGGGANTMIGGFGNDTYVVNNAKDVVFDGVNPSILRLSIDSQGNEANTGGFNAIYSINDRYVIFVSGASNLVSNDNNLSADVFIKDIQTGNVTRVSTNSADQESNHVYDAVPELAISLDGKYLVFSTTDTGLVNGDVNDTRDIYLKNLQTGEIKLVDVSINGAHTDSHGYESFNPSFSPDSKSVLFSSFDPLLVNNGNASNVGVYIKNIQTGAVKLVSTNSLGDSANDATYAYGYSSDGKKILLVSSANNFTVGDSNGFQDVFIKNLQTNAVQLINTDKNGNQANNHSYNPLFSKDGNYVVFESLASNLVEEYTDYGKLQIYIKNLQTGDIQLVSKNELGEAGYGDSLNASISSNGRYVVFMSSASNLVVGDTNGMLDVFVRDLYTNEVKRISVSLNGQEGNGDSYTNSALLGGSTFSSDGGYILFHSNASNLDASDNNSVADVFRVANPFLIADGIDIVIAAISYTLGADIENLTLSGTSGLSGRGNDLDNVITGNSGANKLQSLVGNDTLLGGAGSDTLDGGLGIDSMEGSAGNDVYIVDDINDLVVETDVNSKSGGIDTVRIANTFIGAYYALIANVENLDGSAYISGIDLRGNGLVNTITGGIGNDTLAGSAYETDQYINDGLVDTFKGGKGDDTYHVFLQTTGSANKATVSIQDSIVESANQGTDTVILHGSDNNTLTKASKITLTANLEHLDASDTDSTWLNLTGNVASNQITGNDGHNIILGLGGNDILYGGNGHDTLDGGIGNDVLNGGADDDKLIGGLGNDTLTGGNGSDIFLFNTALNATTNVDTITDFTSGEDHLYLDNAIFKKLTNESALSADNFYVVGSGAQTAHQFIIYDGASGNLFYDADGSGLLAPVLFANLESAPALTAGDIQIV